MDNQNSFSTDQWVDRQLAEAAWTPDTGKALDRFRQRREANRKRRGQTVWICVCAVAAAAAAFGFPSTRVYAQKCAQACVAETNRAAQFVLAKVIPSSVKPAGHADRQLAPDFALTDADGRTVQLSALRGKVVLLNFFATWCQPCGVEIPWFVEFQREFGDRGLAVLGISLDDEEWQAVRPYIAERKVNYPVMVGGDEIIRLYGGVESLPVTIVIDRSGRVAATHIGLVAKQTYEKDIQEVLNER